MTGRHLGARGRAGLPKQALAIAFRAGQRQFDELK